MNVFTLECPDVKTKSSSGSVHPHTHTNGADANENVLVQAPCEAEASCAALVKAGKVYATATEDMDGLTFGTSVLLRHLTASEAKYVDQAVLGLLIRSCVMRHRS